MGSNLNAGSLSAWTFGIEQRGNVLALNAISFQLPCHLSLGATASPSTLWCCRCPIAVPPLPQRSSFAVLRSLFAFVAGQLFPRRCLLAKPPFPLRIAVPPPFWPLYSRAASQPCLPSASFSAVLLCRTVWRSFITLATSSSVLHLSHAALSSCCSFVVPLSLGAAQLIAAPTPATPTATPQSASVSPLHTIDPL